VRIIGRDLHQRKGKENAWPKGTHKEGREEAAQKNKNKNQAKGKHTTTMGAISFRVRAATLKKGVIRTKGNCTW